MAISFVGANGFGNVSGTGATINYPSGTVAGNVLLVHLEISSSGITVTAPSGWTLVESLPSVYGSGQVSYVYVHIAGSETSALFSFSASTYWWATVTAYAGVNTSSPVDVMAVSAEQTNATSISAPTVTTSQAGDQIVYCAITSLSTAAWSAASGTALRVQSVQDRLALFDENQTVAGASALRTFTLSASGNLAVATIALKAASGGSAQTITPASLSDESVGATSAKGIASASAASLVDESIGAPASSTRASVFPALFMDEAVATPAVRAVARAVVSAILDQALAAPNLISGAIAITLSPVRDESLAVPDATARSFAILIALADSASVAPAADAIARLNSATLLDESTGAVTVYVTGGGLVVSVTLRATPALNIVLEAAPALNISLSVCP